MQRQRAQDLRAAVDRLPLSTRQNMLRGLERNTIIVGADGNVRGGRCPMMAASVGSSKVTGKPFARAWDAYAGVRFSRPATRHELQTLRTMLIASIDAETAQPMDLAQAVSTFTVAGEESFAPSAPAPVPVPAPTAGRASVGWTPIPTPPADWQAEGTPAAQPSRPVDPAPLRSDADPPAMDLRAAIEAHMASKERTDAAERAKSRAPKVRRTERVQTGERDRSRELERRHGWAWLRPFRNLDDFERAVQQLEEAERVGIAALEEEAPEMRPRSRGRQPVGSPPGGY